MSEDNIDPKAVSDGSSPVSNEGAEVARQRTMDPRLLQAFLDLDRHVRNAVRSTSSYWSSHRLRESAIEETHMKLNEVIEYLDRVQLVPESFEAYFCACMQKHWIRAAVVGSAPIDENGNEIDIPDTAPMFDRGLQHSLEQILGSSLTPGECDLILAMMNGDHEPGQISRLVALSLIRRHLAQPGPSQRPFALSGTGPDLGEGDLRAALNRRWRWVAVERPAVRHSPIAR